MLRPNPARPLPGTEAPLRGLFIDRWGTLIASEAACLGAKCGPWEFVPRAVDALFRAQQQGWSIYLLGNEAGVAQGLVSEDAWLDHERELGSRLAAHGVRVTRNYACLDHPSGKGPHKRRGCGARPVGSGRAPSAPAKAERVLERSSWSPPPTGKRGPAKL